MHSTGVTIIPELRTLAGAMRTMYFTRDFTNAPGALRTLAGGDEDRGLPDLNTVGQIRVANPRRGDEDRRARGRAGRRRVANPRRGDEDTWVTAVTVRANRLRTLAGAMRTVYRPDIRSVVHALRTLAGAMRTESKHAV
ncbi:MAG TPA: hypothetical protein VFV01_01875 [Spirillospora sp.]|nr:hypothetical protein [Spirillospora sp.]